MPIELSGATGLYAEYVNGTYTSTEERLNGMIVYSKLGDDSKCLYFASNKKWLVAYIADAKADKKWSVTTMAHAKAGDTKGCAHTEIGMSHPALAKKWAVLNSGGWQEQPVVASVMVSLCNINSNLCLKTNQEYLMRGWVSMDACHSDYCLIRQDPKPP